MESSPLEDRPWLRRPILHKELKEREKEERRLSAPKTVHQSTDTDGFVIPSLGIEEPDQTNPDAAKVEPSKPPSPKAKIEESIYLGPHGAPPSQSKQQEVTSSSRKQRFKQKLKEADRRISGVGRENKVENLRELVGGGKVSSGSMAKGTPRDWLDQHCHESKFEKWYQQ